MTRKAYKRGPNSLHSLAKGLLTRKRMEHTTENIEAEVKRLTKHYQPTVTRTPGTPEYEAKRKAYGEYLLSLDRLKPLKLTQKCPGGTK